MLDHPSVAVAGDVDHGDFERAAGGWFAELAAGVGAGAAEPGPEGVAGEAGVLDAEVEVVGVGAQLADDGGDAGWPDDACWPGGCLELVSSLAYRGDDFARARSTTGLGCGMASSLIV